MKPLSILLVLVGLLALACQPEKKAAEDNRKSLPYKSGLGSPELGKVNSPFIDAYVMRDWTLTEVEGGDDNLMDWKGEVIVLNVWATWCGPCLTEIPSLERLDSLLGDTPVRFALVSAEEPAVVKKFLDDVRIGLPVYTAEELPPAFQSQGIPATYIIDKQGNLKSFHLGYAQWDEPQVVGYLKGLTTL